MIIIKVVYSDGKEYEEVTIRDKNGVPVDFTKKTIGEVYEYVNEKDFPGFTSYSIIEV